MKIRSLVRASEPIGDAMARLGLTSKDVAVSRYKFIKGYYWICWDI